MSVLLACLNPGDTILAMDLAHGGHLTHGMRLNFSGKFYRIVSYGVRKEDERIDFDQVARLAREHHPKLVIAGASAYAREIDFGRFAEICREVKALLMVDMAHIAGLVAAGLHADPVPVADFVTSTTHKTLRGPRSGFVLCKQEWIQKINQAVFPGLQGGPLMHVIAIRLLDYRGAQAGFKIILHKLLAARTLAHELQTHGFRLVSGGTDNHLLLVDVASKGLSGKVAEVSLDAAGITVNKNMIPFDQRPALDPSGIRIGTPALTTRGMREPEMRTIAGWIGEILSKPEDALLQKKIRAEVMELCKHYPAPKASVGALGRASGA